MKKIRMVIAVLLLAGCALAVKAQQSAKTGEYYQITVYHFTKPEQQQVLHQYLQQALLPALHGQRIKSVGVFMPIANDTAADKRIYVIMPLTSWQQAADLPATLLKNSTYVSSGAAYLNAPYNNAPYNRMETILLKSFPMAPVMQLPKLTSARNEHVYELRSYEGATEALHRKKVHMFNEGGEVKLFNRLNFNAVFYGTVIAGHRMPNLMYMTSFENMDDRNAHWKTFGADPEWKVLSAKPEYQNTVSRNETILMKAADYSDY